MTTVQNITDRAKRITEAENDALTTYYRAMPEHEYLVSLVDRLLKEVDRGTRKTVSKVANSVPAPAWLCAADVALAILLRDQITDAEFALLTQAWRAVIGPVQ